MEEIIKKIFPDEMQALLKGSDLTEEDRDFIKETFTNFVPSIENCGQEIFECDDWHLLNEKF